MDGVTLFGVVALSVMLVFYMLESRAPVYVLAFAVACLASAAYGFLQGAWPFSVIEVIWAAVAFRRWRMRLSEPAVRRDGLGVR